MNTRELGYVENSICIYNTIVYFRRNGNTHVCFFLQKLIFRCPSLYILVLYVFR